MYNTQVEQIARSGRIELSIEVAATAWLLYDFILTLPDEIRCIWCRRFSSVTFIFLVMRYAALTSLLRVVQSFVNWHPFPDGGVLECQVVWKLHAVIAMVFYTSFAAVLALRAYAISGRNCKASLSVLCFSIVFVFCDGFNNIIGTALPRPWLTGCYQIYVLGGHSGETDGYTPSFNAAYAGIEITGCFCLFIAEVIVQTYTWRNTWQAVQMLDKIGKKRSLSFLLLRDGTVAWMAVSVWAILCGAITSVNLTTITIPFTSIVACRVIMRLRQVIPSDNMDDLSGTKSCSSARFIGNLGAPLDFSDDQNRDDDDDAELVDCVNDGTPAAELDYV